MSPAERIQQLLTQKPGLKAQQIATELGLERADVVTTLHGPMAAEVVQDASYRWWPKAQRPRNATAPAPKTLLATLCRYYLNCLSRESGSGISLRADDTAGYVQLERLPFGEPADF